MTEHTPTPWKVEALPPRTDVVNVKDGSGAYILLGIASTRAAHIVRCVNAHEANERVRAAAERLVADRFMTESGSVSAPSERWTALREALALAKGGDE